MLKASIVDGSIYFVYSPILFDYYKDILYHVNMLLNMTPDILDKVKVRSQSMYGSQAELARACDLTKQTVTNVFKGRHGMLSETWQRLFKGTKLKLTVIPEEELQSFHELVSSLPSDVKGVFIKSLERFEWLEVEKNNPQLKEDN